MNYCRYCGTKVVATIESCPSCKKCLRADSDCMPHVASADSTPYGEEARLGSAKGGFSEARERHEEGITVDYAEMRSTYGKLALQLYALPSFVLWLPLCQRMSGDASETRKASDFALNAVKIPVFPFYLVKLMVFGHIKKNLRRVSEHLSALLVSLEAAETTDSEYGAIQKELQKIELFSASLPKVTVNKWLIFVAAVLLIVFLSSAAPLSPADRGNVTMLVSSIPSGNIGQAAAAISSNSFQALVLALVLPLLLATLFLGVLIPLFGIKRWLFNHPNQELMEFFSFNQPRHDVNKRAGLYALEKSTLHALGVKEPHELQLDLAVYLLFVAPFALYLFTITSFPAGAGLENIFANVSGYTSDALLFVLFLAGLAYLAFTGLYLSRLGRWLVRALVVVLLLGGMGLYPHHLAVLGPVDSYVTLDWAYGWVNLTWIAAIYGILGLGAIYFNTRCLLLRARDTHVEATRLEEGLRSSLQKREQAPLSL